MSWRKRYRELGMRGFLRWLLIKRVGKLSFRKADQLFARQSLVGDPAVFDGRAFPWVAELETGWPAVRRELDTLLEERDRLPTLGEIQPDQGNLSDELWKTFVLRGFGYRSERNCARCPETARLLERIPGLISAWFSILGPGKHITRHAGITKGIVRCHLALKVPRERERCRMQVGDELCVWEEGHCVLFDDSRKHEVWNDTDETRVVLIIDVERPMRAPARILHRAVQAALRFSPFVRDARRNQREWEERTYGRGAAVPPVSGAQAPH